MKEKIKEAESIKIVGIIKQNEASVAATAVTSGIGYTKKLKEYVDENNIDIDIEVDGGINDITAKEAIEAGSNILVAGKYLILSENKSEAVKKLKM